MAFTVLKSPSQVQATRYPMAVKIDADPAWMSATDWHIRATIEWEPVYRSDDFVQLAQARIDPAPDGIVEFDIAPWLDSVVQPVRPEWQALGYIAKVEASGLNRRYNIILEEWEGNTGPITTQTFPERHAVAAGIPEISNWAGTNNFLTRQPRRKRVTFAQPEWLYWMCSPALGALSVRLRFAVKLTSGAVSNIPPFNLTPVEPGDIVRFSAGHNQCFLRNSYGLTNEAESWTVWVEDSGGRRVSEFFDYEVEQDCPEPIRYYLFQTPFGGYDTLRTIGELRAANAVSGQSARIFQQPASYKPGAKEVSAFNTTRVRTYQQATGYMDRETARWAEDLLISDDVWRIGEHYPNPNATGQIYPVLVNREEIPIYQDNEPGALTFRYRDAFNSFGL
jgi:hypothetical protein